MSKIDVTIKWGGVVALFPSLSFCLISDNERVLIRSGGHSTKTLAGSSSLILDLSFPRTIRNNRHSS